MNISKKILTLSILASFAAAPAAFAEHHEGDKGDHKGKMFEKHDTNGDGVISKKEFMDSALDRAEKMFAKMDADSDGNVTKDEAAEAHKDMKKKWKDHKQKKMEKSDDAGEE